MDGSTWLAVLWTGNALLVAGALFVVGAHVYMWLTTPRLSAISPEMPGGRPWPSVSVLVPSKDEEAAIERATRSLLGMDYPALQVVAINDRSTDQTGPILHRIRTEQPALTVVDIDSLPAGWLGKNHANHRGAAEATGEWLLFTDGDVVFAPDTLRRCVALAETVGLDHVVSIPQLVCHGFWERAVQTGVFGLITTRFRVWQLRSPRTPGYVGVGAFNLVRRRFYDEVGGHQRLRMEVADDMKLGLLVRRAGGRQALVESGGRVSVRWQEGVIGSFRGLMKNGFAGLNFSWWMAVPAVAALVTAVVLPMITLLTATPPLLRGLAVLALALPGVVQARNAQLAAGGTGLEGLTQPVVALAWAALVTVSAAVTTWRGGVMWRNTFYSLADLRAGCLQDGDFPLDRVVGWTAPPGVRIR